MRCATEMSGLIGSPVGFLDFSAVNQFSNMVKHKNAADSHFKDD